MFQPISCMKWNSGVTTTLTLCFSLHLPVTYTLKNYPLNECFLCDVSISDLLDYLLVFSHEKTLIKIIYFWEDDKRQIRFIFHTRKLKAF